MKTIIGLLAVVTLTLNLQGQTVMVNYKLKECSEKDFFMKFDNTTDSSDFKIYSGVNRKGNNVKFITKDLKSKSGRMIWFHRNGEIDTEGNFLKGKRNGEWNYYYENGIICMKSTTADGKSFTKKYYDLDGKECCKGENKDYQPPTFQGKPMHLYKDYLQNELNKVSTDFSGSISLTFIVTKTGKPRLEKINNNNSEIKEELIKILEKSPAFEPHLVHNRPEEIKLTIPLIK